MLRLETLGTEVARAKDELDLLEYRSCKERQLVGVRVG